MIFWYDLRPSLACIVTMEADSISKLAVIAFLNRSGDGDDTFIVGNGRTHDSLSLVAWRVARAFQRLELGVVC